MDKDYYRIHHIRPRFKNDVEGVLFFIANSICQIGRLPKKEFKKELNAAIRFYPGNLNSTDKTINNWRTEISALFGLIITENQNIKVVYDTNDNNRVIGLLDASVDSAAHEAISAEGVRVSTNYINSPDDDVLYLDQIQVSAEGVATRV